MGQVFAISDQGFRQRSCMKCEHGTSWATGSCSGVSSGGESRGRLLRQKMQSTASSSEMIKVMGLGAGESRLGDVASRAGLGGAAAAAGGGGGGVGMAFGQGLQSAGKLVRVRVERALRSWNYAVGIWRARWRGGEDSLEVL